MMKRLNTIKYITETSIEDMVSDIQNRNMDIDHVIAASLEARKEFGLKVGLLIDEINKLT